MAIQHLRNDALAQLLDHGTKTVPPKQHDVPFLTQDASGPSFKEVAFKENPPARERQAIRDSQTFLHRHERTAALKETSKAEDAREAPQPVERAGNRDKPHDKESPKEFPERRNHVDAKADVKRDTTERADNRLPLRTAPHQGPEGGPVAPAAPAQRPLSKSLSPELDVPIPSTELDIPLFFFEGEVATDPTAESILDPLGLEPSFLLGMPHVQQMLLNPMADETSHAFITEPVMAGEGFGGLHTEDTLNLSRDIAAQTFNIQTREGRPEINTSEAHAHIAAALAQPQNNVTTGAVQRLNGNQQALESSEEESRSFTLKATSENSGKVQSLGQGSPLQTHEVLTVTTGDSTQRPQLQTIGDDHLPGTPQSNDMALIEGTVSENHALASAPPTDTQENGDGMEVTGVELSKPSATPIAKHSTTPPALGELTSKDTMTAQGDKIFQHANVQLARDFQESLALRKTQFDIRLAPEGLGQVHIQINFDKKTVDANFAVEQASLPYFQKHAHAITEIFESHGFHNEQNGLTFSLHQNGAQHGSHQGFHQANVNERRDAEFPTSSEPLLDMRRAFVLPTNNNGTFAFDV